MDNIKPTTDEAPLQMDSYYARYKRDNKWYKRLWLFITRPFRRYKFSEDALEDAEEFIHD